MFLQNKWSKWVILLVLITMIASGCQNGGEPVQTTTEVESESESTETTTISDAEVPPTPSQNEGSWDALAEDEMLVVYEKPFYEEMSQVPGPFVVYGAGGKVLLSLEDIIYTGNVGILKIDTPLAICFVDRSTGQSKSSVRWGLYDVSKEQYLIEPEYKELYHTVYGGTDYWTYSMAEWTMDYDQSDVASDSEPTPSYVYYRGKSFEGYYAYGDDNYTWVGKDPGIVTLYQGDTAVKEFTNSWVRQMSEDGEILLGSAEYIDEEKNALYAVDGTLLFSLTEWKKANGITVPVTIYEASLKMPYLLIQEDMYYGSYWLVDRDGKIVLSGVGAGDISFCYDYPAYYIRTYDENGENVMTYHGEDGTVLGSKEGIPYDMYHNAGWFSYEKDGDTHLENAYTGEALVLPGFTKEDGYPTVYENGLVEVWIQDNGSEESREKVWDQ